MKNRPTLPAAAALLCLTAPLATAQWRSTTYTLKPGWSSVYLNGDAAWQTLEDHLASQADILEVWRWNPADSQAQFTSSPSEPPQGTPEWSVWRRDQPLLSDLAVLKGQTAYLVRLRDGATPVAWTMKQLVEPPVVSWRRNGANLLAFPTKKTGSVFPAFSTYFGMFPAATASRIFRYNGGALDANNPVRIFSAATERMDSTQAYWFETKVVSDFIGPVSYELSDPTGLNFGRTGSTVTLTFRNKTAVTPTLTLAPQASETPPPGQPAIAGPVALAKRVFNTTTAANVDTPVTAPLTVTLAANASTMLTFAVNRAAMNGAPGSLYASLLRITDAANMMDVYLPVTAGSASMAGLWVGEAEVNAVESKTPGSTGRATERSFPLRYLIHVNAAGQAVMLSEAYVGILNGVDGATGVATTEDALDAGHKDKAQRLSAAHMPLDRMILASGSFSAGGSLSGTINLPFNDPTNPFVHQYHPDHDNLNARFAPLPAGVESWTVNRAVSFTFDATSPAGQSGAWGSRVLTGTYGEAITGVRRDAVTVTGTFTLRRVSEVGTLRTTP